MLFRSNIALELPLKILVYQDASYNVFIKTTDIKQLAKEYRIKNTKVVETISNHDAMPRSVDGVCRNGAESGTKKQSGR